MQYNYVLGQNIERVGLALEGNGRRQVQQQFLLFNFFFSFFFTSFSRTVVHSCLKFFFLPFYGAQWRRPHPWLGSVAVIIPHKQGLLYGKGSFFFFSHFISGARGRGKSREETRDWACELFHLVVQCALDNVCACMCACVYTHCVTNGSASLWIHLSSLSVAALMCWCVCMCARVWWMHVCVSLHWHIFKMKWKKKKQANKRLDLKLQVYNVWN